MPEPKLTTEDFLEAISRMPPWVAGFPGAASAFVAGYLQVTLAAKQLQLQMEDENRLACLPDETPTREE